MSTAILVANATKVAVDIRDNLDNQCANPIFAGYLGGM